MIEIHNAASGRGAAWLLEGFSWFQRNAGAWIGIAIILLILTVVSGFVPLSGLVLQLLMPVLLGGLILGCREIDHGGKLGINHLFAGFRDHTGSLVLLGVLYSLALFVIVLIMVLMVVMMIGGMEFIDRVMEDTPGAIIENSRTMLLIMLTGMLIYLPLLMAFWFAPALIVLKGLGVIDSLKYSFRGCLANIMPFLIYGLLGLALSILATIPFMLGWFVLMPMVLASIYISYKDIFQPAPVVSA